MDINQILIGVIVLGTVVFFGEFIVKKTQFFLKILVRGLTGGGCIWAAQLCLGFLGLPCPVGLNLWTVAVSALLGMPGVVMLYAMGIYAFLI